MASLQQPRPESDRIAFLLERDGTEATRAWVERTHAIYREAVSTPGHFASDAAWRPLFEKSIGEFAGWLSGGSA